MAAILLLVVVLGLAVWAYQGYQLYRSVKVVSYQISGVVASDWEEIPIPGMPGEIPFPKKILIDFEVVVENPTSASFEVRHATYDVYVEDIYLGEGSRSPIVITPGTNRLTFSLETRTEKLLTALSKLIYEAVREGRDYVDIDVEVRGILRIPIKLFNLIEVPGWTATLPYQIRETYRVSIPLPRPPSPPSGVIEEVSYTPRHPSPGESVRLEALIRNAGGMKAKFFVLIKVFDRDTGAPILPEWKSQLIELEPGEGIAVAHSFKVPKRPIVVEVDLYLLPLVLQDKKTVEISPQAPPGEALGRIERASVEVEGGVPMPGNKTVVSITASNVGGAEGKFFVLVEVFDNSTGTPTPALPEWKSGTVTLKPGERAELSYQFTIPKPRNPGVLHLIIEVKLYHVAVPPELHDKKTLEIGPIATLKPQSP